MQEEEALRGAYIQRGPRSERKTNDICYHMLRILKVILEGHPCSMHNSLYTCSAMPYILHEQDMFFGERRT